MYLLLFVLCFHLSSSIHHINNSEQLIQVLSSSNDDNITIKLNSTVVFKLYNHRKFLQISNITSLIIQSSSNATVAINCSNFKREKVASFGLAFDNIKELVLQKIALNRCGTNLKFLNQKVLKHINSSKFYFGDNHSAALVFTNIQSLKLQQVSMPDYYGFAFISYNIPHSSYKEVVIGGCGNVTQPSHHSIGLGALLMYIDIKWHMPASAIVHNSFIVCNYGFHKAKTCINDYFQESDDLYLVANAAGLTIIYFNSLHVVNVVVSDTSFMHNFGAIAGAVLIQQIESPTAQTTFTNLTTFQDNALAMHRTCHGSDLSHYFSEKSRFSVHKSIPLKMTNATFHGPGPGAEYQTSSIYIGIYRTSTIKPRTSFTLQNVKFKRCSTYNTGACVYAASYTSNSNISIALESITASYNSPLQLSPLQKAAIFYFLNIDNILVSGSSLRPGDFSSNFGSVITLVNSVATLSGELLFTNNSGYSGPAIKLLDNSYLYLSDGLRANFTSNKAQTCGGAIYADSPGYVDHQCSFQMTSPHHPDRNNIHIYFINNTAVQAGSSIYSTNAYNCKMRIKNEHVIVKPDDLKSMYHKIFHFTEARNSNKLLNISTMPNKIKQCHSQRLIIYPGRKLLLSLAALDAVGNSVFSSVSINIAHNDVRHGYTPLNSWYIPKLYTEQVINELHCTNISIQLLHKSGPIDQIRSNTANLLFEPSILENFTIMELHDCPPGFDLDHGTCNCSSIVKNFSKTISHKPICDIQSGTISRAPAEAIWAGVIEIDNKSVFAISSTCHQYCNVRKDYNYLVISYDNVTYITNDKDNLNNNISLCLTNRGGPLCSQCIEGTSIVFGSNDCRSCSNEWLWTIVLYIALGPLLIYSLNPLKITLTSGAFNGIIFFAQMSVLLKHDSLVYKGENNKILWFINACITCFLSVINLSIDIPICLYAKMDEFVKTCAHLLFPLYILTIVVFLIVASHFSVSLSNRISSWSVQVLVTIVHLSFASLCGVVAHVFTPTKIYIEGRDGPLQVWYSDGTMKYGKGKHLGLMIATSLVAGIFILPYIIILIGGRFLMRYRKFNKYLRPLHEAIHAPYKIKQQHWFGARLLLVILIYAIHASRMSSSSHLVIKHVLSLLLTNSFTIAQAYYKPFKSKAINTLDLFMMILFTLSHDIYGVYLLQGSLVTSASIDTASIIIVFCIFVVIILHNLLRATGQLDKVKLLLGVMVNRVYKCYRWNDLVQTEGDLEQLQVNNSNREYREPLLSSSSIATRSDSYGSF